MREIIRRFPIFKEMFLYGIIGLTSATIDSVAFVCLRNLDISLLLANFISINIGITISFLLNTFVNFKQTTHLFKRALSFFSVGYIGLALSTLIMFIFVSKLGFAEIIVKIASVFIVAIVQFILNKLITFNKNNSFSLVNAFKRLTKKI